MSKIKFTDAGRLDAGFAGEVGKDCTVRALAIALGIPYPEAHTIMAKLGRKPGRGFRFAVAARSMPDKFTPMNVPRCRASTALKLHNKGRFVFRVRCHVYAVVDGMIHDTIHNEARALRRLITNVWEVTP